MNKELFKDLAEITNQLKELKEKDAIVRKQIIGEMSEAELNKVNSDFGTFSLKIEEVKKFTYSEDYKTKVTEIEESVKPIQEKIDLIKLNDITPLETEISENNSVLETARKEEEENGKATVEVSTKESFRFTPKKVTEEKEA